MASDQSRPQWCGTLAPDVVAFLRQPEVNASRLVEAAVREKVAERRIYGAARDTGMTKEEIRQAKQT